jgi:hypothetical protein
VEFFEAKRRTGGIAVPSAQMQATVVIHSLFPSCMFFFIPPCSHKARLKILFDFPILPRRKPFSSILYDCCKRVTVLERRDVLALACRGVSAALSARYKSGVEARIEQHELILLHPHPTVPPLHTTTAAQWSSKYGQLYSRSAHFSHSIPRVCMQV